MATPNFRTSKNYPLIVNLSDDCDYYNYIEEIVEEFNDELVYHKVELLIGYYEGFQIYISSEITEDEAGNLSFINGSEIDNEEAHYWYDVNLTQLKRNFKKEKTAIKKFLKKAVKELDFEELKVIARALNGETVYERVK